MKTPYTVEQLGIGRPLRWIVKGPGIVAEELHDEFFEIAQAHADRLNAAYQAGLQDQGVGVERIMEVVKQWREEDNTGSIEAVDFPDAMENADSQGWLLLSDLRTRLQALFTQTQVEPKHRADPNLLAAIKEIMDGVETFPAFDEFENRGVSPHHIQAIAKKYGITLRIP